jgi:hypothetical protein
MQFYLAVLDDTSRLEGKTPRFGFSSVNPKNRTIVEYALKESSKPVGTLAFCSFRPERLTSWRLRRIPLGIWRANAADSDRARRHLILGSRCGTELDVNNS